MGTQKTRCTALHNQSAYDNYISINEYNDISQQNVGCRITINETFEDLKAGENSKCSSATCKGKDAANYQLHFSGDTNVAG